MILIKNVAAILDSKTYKEKVNITIKDSTISYVGEAEKPDNYSTVIDGSKYLALPGFVNTHSHLGMTLMRGYAEDVPLQDWLNKYIFPVEGRLTADMVYLVLFLLQSRQLNLVQHLYPTFISILRPQ